MEHEEHNSGKDRDAEPLIGQNIVDLILHGRILGQNLARFNLGNNSVYKSKSLSVGVFYNCLIRKIYIALHVRRDLPFSNDKDGCGNHFFHALGRGRNRLNNRTTELRGECGGINFGFFLFIYVGLVQGNDHGDA